MWVQGMCERQARDSAGKAKAVMIAQPSFSIWETACYIRSWCSQMSQQCVLFCCPLVLIFLCHNCMFVLVAHLLVVSMVCLLWLLRGNNLALTLAKIAVWTYDAWTNIIVGASRQCGPLALGQPIKGCILLYSS